MIKNRVNLKVEGQTSEALIDTGATLSVISEHAISQYKIIQSVHTDRSEMGQRTQLSITYVMLSIKLG